MLLFSGYMWLFPQRYSIIGVKLTTHLHLMLTLRIHGTTLSAEVWYLINWIYTWKTLVAAAPRNLPLLETWLYKAI
jgi:hypothetical protein